MDEFVIEWLRGQAVATVTATAGSALKGRVQKLSIEHPEDYKIIEENKDGSILAHVPVKCISLRAPYNTSEETREKFTAQAKEMLKQKQSNSALND